MVALYLAGGHENRRSFHTTGSIPIFRGVIMERRSKPRIEGPIPATLRYRDTLGNSVEVDTMLDNLSVGGCYVRLEHQIEAAAHLHALIKFTGMKIEANGIVKRVEPKYDGSYGFGVAFENYRILSGR